jgi:hypothetical protein
MKTPTFLLVSAFLASVAHAGIVTVAHPDEKLPAESTVVWSPLFQATWDTMNKHLGGVPERVEPQNALMAKLDGTQWKPDAVMPEGSWKTWGGQATQAFLDQLNREAMELTGDAAAPFKLPAQSSNNTLACFGILDRKVEFVKPFYRSKKIPMEFKIGEQMQSVRYFGAPLARIDEFHDSVRVLYWRPSERSHAIEVTCKQKGESLVLYLPGKPQDFSTACGWLHKWRSEPPPADPSTMTGTANDPFLHYQDQVKIPYVSLDVRAGFEELLKANKRFYQGQPLPLIIIAAEQHTRFKLHEKGAEVRVEASLAAGPFGEPPKPPPTVPRHFIYDRPFFAFLWRDGAEWPYFGVWVGDVSALERVR